MKKNGSIRTDLGTLSVNKYKTERYWDRITDEIAEYIAYTDRATCSLDLAEECGPMDMADIANILPAGKAGRLSHQMASVVMTQALYKLSFSHLSEAA